MIWLDIIDPKYVLFFKEFLPHLGRIDRLLITTRKSEGYDECARLIELFGLKNYADVYEIGGYGGSDKLGKLQARLKRQMGFLELFSSLGQPRLFITGASVEGVQCAYGLGIPVVHFADTPVADERVSLEKLTILSRLTLPLSRLIFRPFVVPEPCYTALGLESSQVIAYDFIDVVLWLKDIGSMKPHGALRADFCSKYGLDSSLPIVLVREEEYKAHYVKQKLGVIYECIAPLAREYNVLLMPRYGAQELEACVNALDSELRARVKIMAEKLEPRAFYPFVDVLVGGGGTMNLEACYLGLPVVSTRSLLLFHDRFLLEHNLMRHATNADEVLELVRLGLKGSFGGGRELQNTLFAPHGIDLEPILTRIEQLYSSVK